jgi:hypothetical protein
MTDRPSSARAGVEPVARLPEAALRTAARTVTLPAGASIADAVSALPDPASLPAGTLVLVPAAPAGSSSLAQSVLAVFGRAKNIARRVRCTALVVRGYERVGAGDDGRADLAWGYSP